VRSSIADAKIASKINATKSSFEKSQQLLLMYFIFKTIEAVWKNRCCYL